MTMKTPRSLEKRTNLSEAKGGGRFQAERDQFIQPTAFQVLCGPWDVADHQLGADAGQETAVLGRCEVSCLNPQGYFKDFEWLSECHAAELPFRLSNFHARESLWFGMGCANGE